VIICNALKAVAMLATFLRSTPTSTSAPLITVGDAIQSFLVDPDQYMTGICYHQENITKIFLLCIWWNSVASGRIIASPPGARYFESLSPERHGRQPGDSWRHPGDTERHRETLEAL